VKFELELDENDRKWRSGKVMVRTNPTIDQFDIGERMKGTCPTVLVMKESERQVRRERVKLATGSGCECVGGRRLSVSCFDTVHQSLWGFAVKERERERDRK
jgi:hypothetical protein